MDNNASSWGDVIARVLVTAGLISCAVPAIFFMIISEAEAAIVEGTLKSYIAERCVFIRPWIPKGTSSRELLSNNVPLSDVELNDRNSYLRLLAFQSSILLLAVLLSTGMAMWLYFGRESITSLMTRTFFYCFVFCVTEITFILIISSLPIIEKNVLDIIFLDRLLEAGKACGA